MKRSLAFTIYNIFLIFTLFLTILILMSGCGSGKSYTSSKEDSGSVALSWSAPTSNEDGTPVTDLSGYIIYYGTSSRNYTSSINVGNITSCTIGSLSPGTYFFALVAYDHSDNRSGYSSEVIKYVP